MSQTKATVKNSKDPSVMEILTIYVLIICCVWGYFWHKFDSNGHVLPAHISEVATLSNNFKKDYGCYPISPNAFTNLSVYKNPEFNSCNETIDIENAYAPSFTKNHNVKIENNQFVLTHILYEAKGDIKIIDNKIIYRLKVSDSERNQQVYDKCVIQHNQTPGNLNAKNYKTVSDENPCGKDIEGNLLLQIGTLSKNKIPSAPHARPRQIANDANFSML